MDHIMNLLGIYDYELNAMMGFGINDFLLAYRTLLHYGIRGLLLSLDLIKHKGEIMDGYENAI